MTASSKGKWRSNYASLRYLAGDELRRVRSKGEITFGNRTHAIGSALVGEVVALRPAADGCHEVFYCWKKLGTIDLRLAVKRKGHQNELVR